MTESIDSKDRAAIEAIVKQLEAAWNAADGDAFAEPFADDADFITIRAEHILGRAAIASGHAGIFRTIYAGSVNQLTLEALRLLRPDVALIHVHAQLDVPAGPLQGKQNARFSAVLTREKGGWQIVSLHNMAIPPNAQR